MSIDASSQESGSISNQYVAGVSVAEAAVPGPTVLTARNSTVYPDGSVRSLWSKVVIPVPVALKTVFPSWVERAASLKEMSVQVAGAVWPVSQTRYWYLVIALPPSPEGIQCI